MRQTDQTNRSDRQIRQTDQTDRSDRQIRQTDQRDRSDTQIRQISGRKYKYKTQRFDIHIRLKRQTEISSRQRDHKEQLDL